MRFFKLTLISGLLAGISQATLITEPPTPIISTACVINGASVPCGTFDGLNRVMASASSSTSGFGSADGIGIDLSASAFTYIYTAQRQLGSALATASIDFLAATDGPQRGGFATYSLYTDGDHGGFAGVSLANAIDGLGGCGGIPCQNQGTMVPFELGTEFGISASIRASSGSDFAGAGGISQIRLRLFEADGTPVVIFDPPAASAVPEPGTRLLSLAGLATIGLFMFRRRKQSHVR